MYLTELADEFMRKYAERCLRPSTVRGYRINLNRHVLPRLGDLDVQMIDVDDLDELTDKLAATGLSNRTIVYVHATVRKMYNYAIRRGYVDFNPYDRFDMPTIKKFHHRVLHEDDIHRLLLCVRGSSLEIPVTLALCYGLRRGECLGVMSGLDVDFGNNVLHVQRSRGIENGREVVSHCKTDSSDRFILLHPDHTALLYGKPGFACPLTPTVLDKRFKMFLDLHGFPSIRFHDLRHSYATLMLSKGVNPKIVSSVLGHSGVDVTLDIYSHPDVSMQRFCLDAFK